MSESEPTPEAKRITLNVGGTRFVTTTSTLEKSSFFVSLLQRWSPPSDSDSLNEIFVDRSPTAFGHILNLMRDIQHPFPEDYLYELGFYGLPRPANVKPSFDKPLSLAVGSLAKMCSQTEIIAKELLSLRETLETKLGDIDESLAAMINVSESGKQYCSKCGNPNDNICTWCSKCKYCRSDCHCHYSGCWSTNAMVLTPSGYRSSGSLKVGDLVTTPQGTSTCITKIYSEVHTNQKMVSVYGIGLTHKHPVYSLDNPSGKWIAPKDHFPVEVVREIALFNLELESIHEVMLTFGQGELRVATMGRFDPNSNWSGTD